MIRTCILIVIPVIMASRVSPASDRIAIRVTASHTEVDSDGFVRNPLVRSRTPKEDGWLSSHTSFTTRDGLALDPTEIPYVVVPHRYRALLGCVVLVTNKRNGRSFVAVAGDVGNRFGEVSIKLAKDLDSRTTPYAGIDNAVSYSFFPNFRLAAKNHEGLKQELYDMNRVIEEVYEQR